MQSVGEWGVSSNPNYRDEDSGPLTRAPLPAMEGPKDAFSRRLTVLHSCFDRNELIIDVGTVKVLLKEGEDPNIYPVDHTSPLEDAIFIYLRRGEAEHFEAIEALVDAGASVHFPLHNKKDFYSPALVATVMTPFTELRRVKKMLAYLFSRGVNPDMPYQGSSLAKLIQDKDIKGILEAAIEKQKKAPQHPKAATPAPAAGKAARLES